MRCTSCNGNGNEESNVPHNMTGDVICSQCGEPFEAVIEESAERSTPSCLGCRGRILVADDSKPIRKLLTDLLESRGYDIETTTDGESTLRPE